MTHELAVWFFADLVGTLGLTNGRLAFRYEPGWLARSDAVPLSQSLPLQADMFDDHACRPFFAGLLPEGEKRRLVAQRFQVSRQNDLALLDGIGGECAGAVTFLPPGEVLPERGDTDAVRWLDEAELSRLLAELPFRPLLAGEEGIRLSLAGAQDKLPVVVAGQRIGLPLSGTPSTHILKPPIANIRDSVVNEAFCMTLAGRMGLDVAACEIRRAAERSFLLVSRYDRVTGADGRLLRLHQEDFCQALGVAPESKYQNEGGPGLAEGFALLRKVTRPSAPQVLRLLDAVIFHVLIGNHDAHGKNFS
ncbi:MAG TPA: type II toxin-antitoxin system HipA family toxin, partial [Fluviicoccus sp.]|nr:type II toxin-antitoxin system HipA family toxin [Fluviicoccus sp.]